MSETLTDSGSFKADATPLEVPSATTQVLPSTDKVQAVSPEKLTTLPEADTAESSETLSTQEIDAPLETPQQTAVAQDISVPVADTEATEPVHSEVPTASVADAANDSDSVTEIPPETAENAPSTTSGEPPLLIGSGNFVSPHSPRKRSKLFMAVVLCLFLLSISGTTITAFFAFDYGMNAYTTYTTLRN